MKIMTRFILDSGDPEEYKAISLLAKKHNQELWGGTTNPSLIAKNLAGQKFTSQEAFGLQKEIVAKILEIVPGAVSAEVYADEKTTAQEMVEQGRMIALWHERVAVKLPTTLEGFKARTVLRKGNILINNTLVFTQQQIFAICLHEHLVQQIYQLEKTRWPTFISPFIGRLDDIGENGMTLVQNGMKLKELFQEELWMLEASVRTPSHIDEGIALGSELITAPAKIFQAWFAGEKIQGEPKSLKTPQYWNPPQEQRECNSLESFIALLESHQLDIRHPLTDKGVRKFAEDWQAILTQSP